MYGGEALCVLLCICRREISRWLSTNFSLIEDEGVAEDDGQLMMFDEAQKSYGKLRVALVYFRLRACWVRPMSGGIRHRDVSLDSP